MKRFYKKGISLFLILLMSFPLCACKSDDSKALTTVKLNEVAHSIFYAPMYVAIEKGYFEDEGIELSLTTGFGADKTMAAVVSGDADGRVHGNGGKHLCLHGRCKRPCHQFCTAYPACR